MFRHIIWAIFLWQLVNNTADCFNNIVFILVANISTKNVSEKLKKNSTLEQVLRVLWLVGATFDSKGASLRRMNSEKFAEKKFAISCFVCSSLLTFKLLNISCKCSENCNMLTKCTYDSAVFQIVLNIIKIFIFIEQYYIEILYEILISILAFIAVYAIKVPVWWTLC